MLDFTKFPAKRMHLHQLYMSDVILYKDKLYLFDRIPNGANSVYVKDMETMKSLKIRITSSDMTFDIVGLCDITPLVPKNDILTLQKGDLFIVEHSAKGGFIFRFDRSSRTTIVATNPMNNKEVRISQKYKCTKIENIPF